MPVIDDVRQTQKDIKDKGFLYQLKYYVYYYKWHVTFGTIALIFIISLIVHFVTLKETVFEVAFLNSYTAPEPDSFYEYSGINPDEATIYFDSNYYVTGEENMTQLSYANLQKLMAYTASGAIDAFISDKTAIDALYNQGFFTDLNEFFSEDFIKENEDKLYYVTMYDTETGEELYDIPVGILINDSSLKNDDYYSEDTDIYFLICVGTSHPDTCLQYFEFIHE